MQSAYGLRIPEVAPELTRVGAGTPCGELMRRYWQPVCLSADLSDLPKRIRILGEDLVAFRDGQDDRDYYSFVAATEAPRWNMAAWNRMDCAAATTVGFTTWRVRFSTCRWNHPKAP